MKSDRRTGSRSLGGSALLGVALLWLGCTGKEPPAPGTESHWLDGCGDNRDCGELSCVCGVCTRDCRNDDGCGQRGDAICVNVASPLVQSRCEADTLPVNDGVCVARCEKDIDCAQGTTCVNGACVPVLPEPDASMIEPPPMAADAGPSLQERLDEVASVDAATSFEVPIAVPPPDESISGADERLTGTWRELGCQPASGKRCARLEIANGAGGGVVGDLLFAAELDSPFGVLQEPSDPSVGYPVGITTTELDQLRQSGYHDVRYRMLDGQWDGTLLRFRWSTADLWHRWCLQQTPYPWLLGGIGSYRCVPQEPVEQMAIELNKRLLCRVAEGSPPIGCEEFNSYCKCQSLRAGFCPAPMCSCTATACEADTHQFLIPIELVFTTGLLVGKFQFGHGNGEQRNVTFAREEP